MFKIMNQNDLRIGNYNAWNLFLDEDQSTIGKCYITPKRASVNSMSDVFNGDLGILYHELIPQWKNAVKTCFQDQYQGYDILISGSGTYKFQIDLIPKYNHKESENKRTFLPRDLHEIRRNLESHLK